MEAIDIHNYVIKINGKRKATAKKLSIAEEYYKKLLNELLIKHSSRLCEEIDVITLINVETNAILEQASFN